MEAPVRSRVLSCVLGVTFLLSLQTVLLPAQTSGSLSGRVTTASGATVAFAKVSARNSATGQTTETQTNSYGVYQFENLVPGAYEISSTAEGVGVKTASVTISAGTPQTLDLSLTPASSELSLSDLGFTPAQTQANPAEQARLNRRSHMLKIHQKLGLITAAPLLATIITGFGAGGRQTSSSSRDLHVALGSTTAALYFTTASFAIFAPKIPGTETRGPIRWHKALAWVHGTGMILTPILGAMAFNQKSKGERVHGIASLHGPVAVITGAAYGAALLSVSVKF
jgi:Carboxypeptidase regulatory-like domain